MLEHAIGHDHRGRGGESSIEELDQSDGEPVRDKVPCDVNLAE